MCSKIFCWTCDFQPHLHPVTFKLPLWDPTFANFCKLPSRTHVIITPYSFPMLRLLASSCLGVSLVTEVDTVPVQRDTFA